MARRAESAYNTKLRSVARQIGAIVRGWPPDAISSDPSPVMAALTAYSELLQPWARSVAAYMLSDVARRNAKAWKELGADMGRALRVELEQAPTGSVFRTMMQEQVDLITSLPLDAANRVHRLTRQGLLSSTRAADIAKEILRTEEVSLNRATLIARTEVARTAATLTRARAEFAGSEGYIWRTSGDGDVRDTHRKMNGKYVRWDEPPKTDANLDPYHAGCGPNCRCYPEPILPDL
jgi:SPP1 gp7 family putative phage head morphogenesis protein